MTTPHGKPLALEQSQFKFPEVVCALDLETSGKDALKPDRADLAVVGLKVYIWDEQEHSYPPGHYEHYAPTEFLALQQRLDELPGPIIGHNLFNFDYLILRRHLNLEHIVEKTVDTLHFLYEQGGGGEDGSLYQGVTLKEKPAYVVCNKLLSLQARTPFLWARLPFDGHRLVSIRGHTIFSYHFPAYVALGCSERCLEIYLRMWYYFR
jgi:hypothetical protein